MYGRWRFGKRAKTRPRMLCCRRCCARDICNTVFAHAPREPCWGRQLPAVLKDESTDFVGSYALSPQACRYYWAESGIILRLLSIGKTLPPSYTHTNWSSGDSVGSYINVLWMQLDDMTSRVNAVLYSWLQGGFSGTSGEKETL